MNQQGITHAHLLKEAALQKNTRDRTPSNKCLKPRLGWSSWSQENHSPSIEIQPSQNLEKQLDQVKRYRKPPSRLVLPKSVYLEGVTVGKRRHVQWETPRPRRCQEVYFLAPIRHKSFARTLDIPECLQRRELNPKNSAATQPQRATNRREPPPVETMNNRGTI